MADITRCPHCLGAVYEDAPYCPSCQKPLGRKSRRIFTRGAVAFILSAVSAFVLVDGISLLSERRAYRLNDERIVRLMIDALAGEKTHRLPSSVRFAGGAVFDAFIEGARPLAEARRAGHRIEHQLVPLPNDPGPHYPDSRQYILTIRLLQDRNTWTTIAGEVCLEGRGSQTRVSDLRWRNPPGLTAGGSPGEPR